MGGNNGRTRKLIQLPIWSTVVDDPTRLHRTWDCTPPTVLDRAGLAERTPLTFSSPDSWKPENWVVGKKRSEGIVCLGEPLIGTETIIHGIQSSTVPSKVYEEQTGARTVINTANCQQQAMLSEKEPIFSLKFILVLLFSMGLVFWLLSFCYLSFF